MTVKELIKKLINLPVDVEGAEVSLKDGRLLVIKKGYPDSVYIIE